MQPETLTDDVARATSPRTPQGTSRDAPAGLLQLPHTPNCLVCGRGNPHGLKLDLFVDPNSGVVSAEFVTEPHHVGFEGIIHGGLLATVLDEAMVWAATWNIKRFVLCGELNVRFRQGAIVGQRLRVAAKVDFSRPKLIEPSAKLFDEYHKLLATAGGKYVPVSPEQHRQFVQGFDDDDERTREAAKALGMIVPSGAELVFHDPEPEHPEHAEPSPEHS